MSPCRYLLCNSWICDFQTRHGHEELGEDLFIR
ncbi:hypothetical protein Gohar_022161 [Gossypium harknessii]|uniref:Uncharacterized protein n=1 Tax=Gossypium harknessii TaxID=34285 RepID=A0A7J9I5K2_9ROSI|nr:hypothetical protein [Gossypium harknessii]